VLVFCHAIGTEHMLTQRMETLGSRLAANAGFAAFRYHARAHGDSAGESHDVTFDDLIEDACTAADMARQLSGASRIVWVGVRLGCLIAAEAMCRRDDAGAFALWEPLHRGSDYFHSLFRATFFSHIAKGKRPGMTVDDMLKQIERDGEFAVVAGYVYRALYRSACGADLARSLQGWNGPTLIAQVQRRRNLSKDNQHLRSAIEQRGGATNVAVALISEEPPWNLPSVVRPQWTSDGLLSTTKEWLDGLE
jgi:pimeloyl-ACP methyl ester carboxylesterase